MNVFVATIDTLNDYSVSFATLPVINGSIVNGGETISLSDNEKDGWSDCLIVEDEDDSPELREELAGVLTRRFESTRERFENSANLRHIEEIRGMTSAQMLARPMPKMTLKMLERAPWDSEDAKKKYIDFFKEHGIEPVDFDDDGNPLALGPSPKADFCEAKLEDIIDVVDDTEFPDMPENVIISSVLGDICNDYFRNFPRSYAWPAILTVAGAMVPPPERNTDEILAASAGAGSQTNLYTALIGPIGSGKSQAIAYAVGNLGLPKTKYSNTKAGSIEGLLKNIAKDGAGAAYFGTRQLLMDLDEWSHFFKKAGIDNASFVDILNTGYNNPVYRLTIAKGEKVDLNCALSFVGGIVQDRMQDCFGAESIGGFHDRFLFGVCPTVSPYQYFPFDFAESAQSDLIFKSIKPVSVRIDKSVWRLAQDWKKQDATLGRSVEVTARCCAIVASFEGQRQIVAKDLEAMRPFLDYQQRCRQLVTPNPGISADAKMSNAILGWLKRHADTGAWANQRALKKGIHNALNEIGPTAFNNTLKNLIFIRAVQVKVQPNDGTRPSHLIRLAKGM